jgi:branched-chain amino acid transport system ATP-binding protein
LAPIIRAEIWRVLRKLKEGGQSILLIDKNLKAVARFADRHYVIERGRVKWSGDSRALIAQAAEISRYIGV